MNRGLDPAHCVRGAAAGSTVQAPAKNDDEYFHGSFPQVD
jgi:hypothetical protein